MKYIIYGLLLICFSQSVHAQWVQGKASSTVVDDSILDEIREEVLKNAIIDATYKSGSVVAAEEIVLNGLLVGTKTEIRSSGRIQRVEILSERIENQMLYIEVNVNLTPLFGCVEDDYSRSVLVTQFQLLQSSQASYGGIYDLGDQITKRFETQLREFADNPNVLRLDKTLISPREFTDLRSANMLAKSDYLLKVYGRQFVVFGFVRDIGMFEQDSPGLDSETINPRRNFTVEVFVLDTIRQQLILEKSYHGEARWGFSRHDTIDMLNSLFWRSDFGRMILNTVNNAVSDINNLLVCQPMFAQVVNKQDETIVISMGQKDGIERTHRFSLLKRQVNVGFGGTSQVTFDEVQGVDFYVKNLSLNSTELATSNPFAVHTTQLFDIVKVGPPAKPAIDLKQVLNTSKPKIIEKQNAAKAKQSDAQNQSNIERTSPAPIIKIGDK